MITLINMGIILKCQHIHCNNRQALSNSSRDIYNVHKQLSNETWYYDRLSKALSRHTVGMICIGFNLICDRNIFPKP